MYQSLENTGSPFMGCCYCKISGGGNECQFHVADIKRWLRTETGVNLSVIDSENSNLEKEVCIGTEFYE